MTAPARALGPILRPIFSPLFVEMSQPRTQTSSLAGCSKGPVTNLFCWGRYLLSFPPWPPHATKTDPPAWVSREQRAQGGGGVRPTAMPALPPDGSSPRPGVQASHTTRWEPTSPSASEAHSSRKDGAQGSTHRAWCSEPEENHRCCRD